MFESSEETPGVAGLGILPGEIVKFPETPGFKIPHIGWNSLELTNNGRLFKDIDHQAYVYFVHSYYLKEMCIRDRCGTGKKFWKWCRRLH